MKKDIIVIGASAGGVETLQRLVGLLPKNLGAAILIAQHVAPHSQSMMPQILKRSGLLDSEHPKDGEKLRKGKIYVAPPNRHILIRRGLVHVSYGPKENNHRPAIDTLFRSAALACGSRVVGIILTGMLGDGVAGLASIKACGGLTLVQSPEEAPYPTLPLNAIENVDVDHVGTVEEIANILIAAVGRDDRMSDEHSDPEYEKLLEIDVESELHIGSVGGMEEGPPSVFTCPDCNGTLFEIEDKGFPRFRCRVGHSFSLEALSHSQAAKLEDAMYSALRVLQEHQSLLMKMADRARGMGHEGIAVRHEEMARESNHRAKVISQVIDEQVKLISGEVV